MRTGTELIDRARSGDSAAFEQLVGPYRHEMQVHCYRMLGSVADAEDALQETLTAAWQGLGRFEGRAAIRTWLYRIATSRCLNMLRAARRRPVVAAPLTFDPPEPTRLGEITWLEPYPDTLWPALASTRLAGTGLASTGLASTALASTGAVSTGLADPAASPEARYEAHEAISLAFVTALQLLPPRQRAVLILRDVLDFSAREVAALLSTPEQATTEQSVTSALKRARATLARELPSPDRPAPPPGSPAEQAVVNRLIRAFEDADVDALVSLLTDDVWVRMPPVPLEYQGRDLARNFFATVAFRQGRRYRLIPVRANGQPAFAGYLRDPRSHLAHATGLFVLTLAGPQISAITRFDNTIYPRLALPRTLPDD